MKPAAKTVIRRPRPWEAPALKTLFAHAIERSFDYFTPQYRALVQRDNTTLKIILGTLRRNRIILVARQEGRMIGYLFGAVGSDGVGRIFWLYVTPEARGSNVGLALLARSMRIMREQGAEVAELGTYDHRPYYERQGFVFSSQRHEGGCDIDILRYRL